MSVFTAIAPIEISKHIMDLFCYEQSAEECLIRVLFKMLAHVEPRCLLMGEEECFGYLKTGKFIIDAFDEVMLEDLFR